MSEMPSLISSLIDEDDSIENEDGRCEYLLSDGVRCRNHARPGSHYCGIHETLEQSGSSSNVGEFLDEGEELI